jgi:hypothetical protein
MNYYYIFLSIFEYPYREKEVTRFRSELIQELCAVLNLQTSQGIQTRRGTSCVDFHLYLLQSF